ncbi:hypothetical protein [Pseudomonas sp.]|uniref:hypothetical protein n=1 Tax=Pseudomonas sp. TaxID=306 RepID=UPI002589D1B0|nr:hypothetical protein [Pseudomonas sp.]
MSVKTVSDTAIVIDTQTPSIIEENAEITPDSVPEISPESTSASPPESLDNLIRVLKEGNCPSLTGRSTLGFQLGLKDESELHVRLVSNTGSGFFSKEWVACAVIEQLINGSAELTSTSFKAIFPNKSVNTGGFVMAVIKALGLIQTNGQNSRWHEHVTGMTFEQVAIEAMVQADEAQQVVSAKGSGKRKHKEG